MPKRSEERRGFLVVCIYNSLFFNGEKKVLPTIGLKLLPFSPLLKFIIKTIARIILKKKIMVTKNRNKRYAKRVSMAQRHEEEIPVYGNLVVTPSQMLKMAEKGIPISSQNTVFQPSDGEKNPSFDLSLDRLRGVDPAAMWEQSQVIKQKARAAHIRDRQRYGDKPLNE